MIKINTSQFGTILSVTFTQPFRVMMKLELWHHSVVDWHKGAEAFAIFDYARELAVKKSCVMIGDHLNLCSCSTLFCTALNKNHL